MNLLGKENLPISISHQIPKRPVVNLKILNSLRESVSPVNNSALSSRIKRRSQVLKTLDFNIQRAIVPISKNVKGDHSISMSPVKVSKTARKTQNEPMIILNNRAISKNIIFDHFPYNH